MTWVKICGISDIATAVAASEAGTNYVGMVFAPSRRQVTPADARKIVEAVLRLDPRPQIVGVFVNQPADEVNRLADYCKLDWVQLSGDENWEYCKKISTPLIKVFHIAPDARQAEISTAVWKGYSFVPPKQLICLLDSAVAGTYGGTGTPFHWQIAKAVAAKFSVMIAGGLTPENVWELMQLTQPWGVDVSTGVETNGKKDIGKIKAFIETVRKFDLEHAGGNNLG
ncbi:MAG: phosphoribosylanthranilate isomerase [Dehalococcoidales bacterium]